MRRDRKDDEWHPPMPTVEVGGILISYLFEIGPACSTGMGAVPISHQEIEAWCRLSRVDLTPWESRFLRRLSSEYIGASIKAAKADARPPWHAKEVSEEQQRVAADGLRNAIRSMRDM